MRLIPYHSGVELVLTQILRIGLRGPTGLRTASSSTNLEILPAMLRVILIVTVALGGPFAPPDRLPTPVNVVHQASLRYDDRVALDGARTELGEAKIKDTAGQAAGPAFGA